MRLRTNPLTHSNDPRETGKFSFGALNPNYKDIQEQIETNNQASDLIKKGVNILCFSKDYKLDEVWWDGYNLPRMWATYGRKHQGACLEIDLTKFKLENEPFFQGSDVILGDINYSNQIDHDWLNFNRINEIGFENYLEEFRRKNSSAFFLCKHRDWESEHEWRIVHFSDNHKQVFLSIRDSLKQVIVGSEFPKESLKILYNLVGNKISQVQYANDRLCAFRFKNEFLETL